MINAIKVKTEMGEKVFYLFNIHSMTACKRTEKVKADFTATLEYVREDEASETPSQLVGITEMETGELLDIFVLERVDSIVKDAFCNKKPILAWVTKDQGANLTTIEAVITLPTPTEAEHVNYYKREYEKAFKRRDM